MAKEKRGAQKYAMDLCCGLQIILILHLIY